MSEIITIKNARLGASITDIKVMNGKIISIGKAETSCGKTIDLGGKRIAPGLIDIHSHGCIGFDTMTASAEEFSRMRKFYKENGVTSWYPTTMTMPFDMIEMAVTRPDSLTRGEGAHIPGYHMEGPFINKKYKGAQNEEYISAPLFDKIKGLENVKLITVAPEHAGSLDFIKECEAAGIRVSLGHTDCDYDTAKEAFDAGAVCLTHTFNAMNPLLHRAPGPIGAALTEGAYAQVICDGVHIHKAAILALYKIFGSERTVLISDSMQAAGLGDGSFVFGGQTVTVKDGVARTESGALAGGTATLFDCVRCAIDFGIPPEDALKMASEAPARLMGINKGKIEVGYDADFIILDENYKLIETIIL